jgi:transcriptional regulator with XRE-family HTH domain
MPPDPPARHQAIALGSYLRQLREGLEMSLRDVEEETKKQVSNAYLSQLENGKIAQPSPSILDVLSTAYGVPYEKLMKEAGYIKSQAGTSQSRRRSNAATYAIEDLNPEEERALRAYLQVLRRTKKSDL